MTFFSAGLLPAGLFRSGQRGDHGQPGLVGLPRPLPIALRCNQRASTWAKDPFIHMDQRGELAWRRPGLRRAATDCPTWGRVVGLGPAAAAGRPGGVAAAPRPGRARTPGPRPPGLDFTLVQVWGRRRA